MTFTTDARETASFAHTVTILSLLCPQIHQMMGFHLACPSVLLENLHFSCNVITVGGTLEKLELHLRSLQVSLVSILRFSRLPMS